MAPSVEIGALTVDYDTTVLEPRPWTAAQARWAAELASSLPPGPLLELCTGAGHIGLLTALLTGRDAVLVDASPAACRFAQQNADQVRAVDSAVDVRLGLMDEVLDDDELFPLVLADPPYVPTADLPTFPEDPRLAIDGGSDGLELVRTCLSVGGRHLAPGGAMVLQVRDAQQATRLAGDAAGAGLDVREVSVVASRGALVLLMSAGTSGSPIP